MLLKIKLIVIKGVGWVDFLVHLEKKGKDLNKHYDIMVSQSQVIFFVYLLIVKIIVNKLFQIFLIHKNKKMNIL